MNFLYKMDRANAGVALPQLHAHAMLTSRVFPNQKSYLIEPFLGSHVLLIIPWTDKEPLKNPFL